MIIIARLHHDIIWCLHVDAAAGSSRWAAGARCWSSCPPRGSWRPAAPRSTTAGCTAACPPHPTPWATTCWNIGFFDVAIYAAPTSAFRFYKNKLEQVVFTLSWFVNKNFTKGELVSWAKIFKQPDQWTVIFVDKHLNFRQFYHFRKVKDGG